MKTFALITTLLLIGCIAVCTAQEPQKESKFMIGGKEVSEQEMKNQTGNMRLPKIVMEFPDEVTGKYPSEMTPEERTNYEKRKQQQEAVRLEKVEQARQRGDTGEDQEQEVVQRDFKMGVAEIIEVVKKDEDTRILTVKLEGGKTIKMDVPSYVTVTKTFDVSELPKGEKIEIHYMESDEGNELMYISTNINEIPQMPDMEEIRRQAEQD